MLDPARKEFRWPKRIPTLLRRLFSVRAISGASLPRTFNETWDIIRTMSRLPDFGSEKVLSRKYQFLWICNPKVGSRSILSALFSVDPSIEIIEGQTLFEVYARYPEVRSYHHFSFIRHPFDRALSFYREINFLPEYYDEDQIRKKQRKRQGIFDRSYGLRETDSFESFCRWLTTCYGSDSLADRHFLSQHLIVNPNDEQVSNWIGRLENIETDWRSISTFLGLPPVRLPLLNTRSGWQPTWEAIKATRTADEILLTQRSKELLRTRYAEDFNLGGYSLEEIGSTETSRHTNSDLSSVRIRRACPPAFSDATQKNG